MKKFLSDEKLLAIFRQFDVEGDGKITKENIVEAMAKMGHTITQEELDDIMRKHDSKRDGYLTFDEFKQVFFKIT